MGVECFLHLIFYPHPYLPPFRGKESFFLPPPLGRGRIKVDCMDAGVRITPGAVIEGVECPGAVPAR